MSSGLLSLAFAGLLLALFLLYRAALPRPIPGIPYIASAARNPLGNLPLALAHKNRTGSLSSYFPTVPEKLNAPLVQIFMKPFGPPSLILNDAREAQDVCLRRSRDFELSDFYIDLHRAAWPLSQPALKSNERWRENRRLLAEAMSPQFLRNVGLEIMYNSGLEMVELIGRKAAMAVDSCVDVKRDLQHAASDIIWRFGCGEQLGATRSQLNALSEMTTLDYAILDAKLPDMDKAFEAVSASSQIAVDSPLGFKHHWLSLKIVPKLRRAVKLRDSAVREVVQRAVNDFNRTHEAPGNSALSCMLNRLRMDDTKTVPSSEVTAISAELGLLAHAGRKTVADTLGWAVKYAAAYPAAQAQMRAGLRLHFKSGTPPPKDALATASLPHMDAFIHEVMRIMPVAPAHIRVASADTQLLGHFVPKGTDIFMPITGPGYTSQPFPIRDEQRSNSSKSSAVAESSAWQSSDLESFRPERWLRNNEQTDQPEFDSHAAPVMAFSEGPRACFGTRFAMLEMRVLLGLILWHFEIEAPDSKGVDFTAVDFLTIEPREALLKFTKI